MIKQWKALPSKERRKVQIVIAFLIIAVYGLIIYPSRHKSFQNAKNMLNRRINRIETRGNIDNLPTVGLSPTVLEARIKDAEKKLAVREDSSEDLDYGFAAPDDAEAHQQLLLEITTLAERTDVKLLSMSRKATPPPVREAAPKRKQRGRAPDVVEPSAPIRPLMIIRANAPFVELLDFLRGLKDLSFYVCVMNLKIYSTPPSGERSGVIQPGTLYAIFEVSI